MVERSKATFEEIGRVRVSPTTEVVVSTVTRAWVQGKSDQPKDDEIVGININTYVTSKHFTGFSKGIFVPNEKIADFAKLIQLLGV